MIIIGDGSTDGSDEIAKAFSDPRIRIICDSNNLGLACRLNQIAKSAKGQFLFRMDADDMMHPVRIERQLVVLQNAAVNTVVGSAAVEIDDQDRPQRVIKARGSSGGGYTARNAFLHPTVAAYTKWFQMNPYSEHPIFRRVQDAELWVRTAATSQFVTIDTPLLFYRRPQHISFDKYLWQGMALLKILSEPDSGSLLLRLRCSFYELAKLQLRFVEECCRLKKPYATRAREVDRNLISYEEVIARIIRE